VASVKLLLFNLRYMAQIPVRACRHILSSIVRRRIMAGIESELRFLAVNCREVIIQSDSLEIYNPLRRRQASAFSTCS
jgi:hypothetical protein